jgi:hypothetical protein
MAHTCLRAELLGSHAAYIEKAQRMGGKAVALGRPIVTVMQSAQAIMRKHAPRAPAASSAPRRSLFQSKMRAVFVMVGDVLGKSKDHRVAVVVRIRNSPLATAG